MSFWKELQRRNVVKVGIAYTIVAWLIIHPVDIMFPTLHLPEWTVTLVTALFIIGFPFMSVRGQGYTFDRINVFINCVALTPLYS